MLSSSVSIGFSVPSIKFRQQFLEYRIASYGLLFHDIMLNLVTDHEPAGT